MLKRKNKTVVEHSWFGMRNSTSTFSVMAAFLFVFSSTLDAATLTGRVSDLRTCEPGMDDGKNVYSSYGVVERASEASGVANIAVSLKENPSIFTTSTANGDYSIDIPEGDWTLLFNNSNQTSGTFYSIEIPINVSGDILKIMHDESIVEVSEINRQMMPEWRDPIYNEHILNLIKHFCPLGPRDFSPLLARYTGFPIKVYDGAGTANDPGQITRDSAIQGCLSWNNYLGFEFCEQTTNINDATVIIKWITSGTIKWRPIGYDARGSYNKSEIWLFNDLGNTADGKARFEMMRPGGMTRDSQKYPLLYICPPVITRSIPTEGDIRLLKNNIRLFSADTLWGAIFIDEYSTPTLFTIPTEPPRLKGNRLVLH